VPTVGIICQVSKAFAGRFRELFDRGVRIIKASDHSEPDTEELIQVGASVRGCRTAQAACGVCGGVVVWCGVAVCGGCGRYGVWCVMCVVYECGVHARSVG
jgi:hypothetical protein